MAPLAPNNGIDTPLLKASPTPVKILVVNHRATKRRLLCAAFQAEGFSTLEADDGRHALALLQDGTPDVIISDVLMPNMDGYSFCRAVRENPAFDRVPFIIYTNTWVSHDEEETALKYGADRYIRKSAAALDILQAVRDSLAAGPSRPSRRPPPAETEIYKQYNEDLVHKLEEMNLKLTERTEKLMDSEEKFNQLMEHLTKVFFLTGAEGAPIHYISPAYEKVWGRSCASLYAAPLSWMDPIVGEDRQKVQTLIAQHPEGFSADFRIARPDGEIRWLRTHTFSIMDAAGLRTRVGGLTEDITPLKKTEALLRQSQKLEGVGQLAGGVAHDFNNLLTAIMGFTELSLRQLPEGHPIRADLEGVIVTGQRAAKLTNQLLVFSRKQLIEPKVFDLNNLIASTNDMLRRLIPEDVDLSVRPAAKLWPVRADPGQLEQVIVNLCVNARDAMPNGGKLTIETANTVLESDLLGAYPGVPPGEYVLMAVSDNGTGMTDEVKEHLFEPFFTTKEQGRGTGLGLATCYGIVQQSGGHISVYSEMGHGTTFKVYLPRTQTAPAVLSAVKSKAPPRGTETILLVEDDPSVRVTSARMLRALGYTVLEAPDGQEAMRLARGDVEKNIRLMLTDVVMPGKNGRLVAQELSTFRTDVKTIFTSGYTDDAIIRHGVLEPGISFLRKPFTMGGLAEKIRDVLDERLPEKIHS